LFRLPARPTDHHEVVGVSREAIARLVEPPVEMVQSDVRQQGRGHAGNNLANIGLILQTMIPRSRLKPQYGRGSGFTQGHMGKEVT